MKFPQSPSQLPFFRIQGSRRRSSKGLKAFGTSSGPLLNDSRLPGIQEEAAPIFNQRMQRMTTADEGYAFAGAETWTEPWF